MRRSLFLTASLAASLAAIAQAADAPLRIAVLGDSLARGTGASRADGGFVFPAFRDLLQRRPGSMLDSFAIGGAVVADVERLQVPRLHEAPYDVVVVCVGGNDVARRSNAAAFAASYRRMVRMIRAIAPRARLLLCGVPDVGLSPIFAGDAPAISALALRDDRAVRTIARAARAEFVDFFRASHDGGTHIAHFLAADRFHPSDAGYMFFERVFAAVLDR